MDEGSKRPSQDCSLCLQPDEANAMHCGSLWAALVDLIEQKLQTVAETLRANGVFYHS